MFGGQWWIWWDIMAKPMFSKWGGQKNCRRDQICSVDFQYKDTIRCVCSKKWEIQSNVIKCSHLGNNCCLLGKVGESLSKMCGRMLFG